MSRPVREDLLSLSGADRRQRVIDARAGRCGLVLGVPASLVDISAPPRCRVSTH